MNDLSGAEGQFQICCGHICSLIWILTTPLSDDTVVYMLAHNVIKLISSPLRHFLLFPLLLNSEPWLVTVAGYFT